jgi:hypothetical protein
MCVRSLVQSLRVDQFKYRQGVTTPFDVAILYVNKISFHATVYIEPFISFNILARDAGGSLMTHSILELYFKF